MLTILNRIRQQQAAQPLIPASANIASLLCWITAEEQTGSDGSTITTITDQTGNVTGITTSNVLLNITAGGIKEFDFSSSPTTNNPRINLGQPAFMDFGQTDNHTILVIQGEIAPANTSTYWAKHDKDLNNGPGDNALFLVDNDTAFIYSLNTGLSFGYGAHSGFPTAGEMVAVTKTWSSPNIQGRFYINGTQYDSVKNSTTNTPYAADWMLGIQAGLGSAWIDHFEGSFRAFGVFSEVLSTTVLEDIRTEYNS